MYLFINSLSKELILIFKISFTSNSISAFLTFYYHLMHFQQFFHFYSILKLQKNNYLYHLFQAILYKPFLKGVLYPQLLYMFLIKFFTRLIPISLILILLLRSENFCNFEYIRNPISERMFLHLS